DLWCGNFVRGQGCSIYSDRPPSCRAFACNWLVDVNMGPEWKPNECGMVIEAREMTLAVHVDPGTDRPWSKEPYFSRLTRIAKQRISRGSVVLVFERGRNILILPDRTVDLGVMGKDDRIGLAEIKTAT